MKYNYTVKSHGKWYKAGEEVPEDTPAEKPAAKKPIKRTAKNESKVGNQKRQNARDASAN